MQFAELTGRLSRLPSEKQIIGRSSCGQEIAAYFIGDRCCKNKILITAGMHAREWISSLLVMELMQHYAAEKPDGCLVFVPLCNPDGVRLAIDGIQGDFFSINQKKFLLELNHNSNNFSLWKANANGVDLNVNFNADWGKGKSNVFFPSPANFVGRRPNSEAENKALMSLAKKLNPCMAISYHSKGEVIYYGFEKSPLWRQNRDQALAEIFSGITGYAVEKSVGSTGGFSDWLSLHFGISAFTFEIGSDDLRHPITERDLPHIFRQNKDVPKAALLLAKEKSLR